MVNPNKQSTGNILTSGPGKHFVFVLDESRSMTDGWSCVVQAYNRFSEKRRNNQCGSDLVSVVQFESNARTTVDMVGLSQAPADLDFRSGGTNFNPAATSASDMVKASPHSHAPVVVFMSDGAADDSADAAATLSDTNSAVRNTYGDHMELHVIAFGIGANTSQLQAIADASPRGKLYSSSDTTELSDIFVNIAGGQDVSQALQAEVGKRISDAVSDRLSIEYLG